MKLRNLLFIVHMANQSLFMRWKESCRKNWSCKGENSSNIKIKNSKNPNKFDKYSNIDEGIVLIA